MKHLKTFNGSTYYSKPFGHLSDPSSPDYDMGRI